MQGLLILLLPVATGLLIKALSYIQIRQHNTATAHVATKPSHCHLRV